MKLPSLLVTIAKTQIGKHETGGANKGSDLRAYFESDNYKPNSTDDGYPWCASFVCWCVIKAMQAGGVDETPTFRRPKTPSAFGLATWSRDQDNSTLTKDWPGSDIKAGDIVIYQFSHTGIAVTDAVNGMFEAIEGNTNQAGSREGTHVMKKTRPVSSVRNRIRFTV